MFGWHLGRQMEGLTHPSCNLCVCLSKYSLVSLEKIPEMRSMFDMLLGRTEESRWAPYDARFPDMSSRWSDLEKFQLFIQRKQTAKNKNSVTSEVNACIDGSGNVGWKLPGMFQRKGFCLRSWGGFCHRDLTVWHWRPPPLLCECHTTIHCGAEDVNRLFLHGTFSIFIIHFISLI